MPTNTERATDVGDTPDLAWRRTLEEIGEDQGYFEQLGRSHSVLLADRGPVLLVTFEAEGAIRSRHESGLPYGYRLGEEAGHSSLTVISARDTWFRDPAVYGYFDRLSDEGFFEDFDRVVFYGTGPCGYAAAAYSVTAPGATVVTIQPQATLEPLRAGWDDRFTEMRRTSFTDRYGYAPDMLDGAARAYVIYDPLERLDAMHAALLGRSMTTLMPCPGLGTGIEEALASMGVLSRMLLDACAGSFQPQKFRRLYRARRNSSPYLRGLARRLDDRDHLQLEALLCRRVLAMRNAPWFRTRLSQINSRLAEQGEEDQQRSANDNA